MNGVPCLYEYYQMKLAEHSGSGGIMTKDKAFWVLRPYRVPKQLKLLFLKELESLNLIEFLDNKTIRIINCRATKEDMMPYALLTRRKNFIKLIV